MPMLEIKINKLEPLTQPFDEISFETVVANGSEHTQYQALVIDNDVDLASAEVDFSQFGAVIFKFPSFGDGRAYTQAYLLRNRFGFRGAIIARGDILPDQLLYMKRCGVTIIETDRNDISIFENALVEFSYFYQVSADSALPVWNERSLRRQVAA